MGLLVAKMDSEDGTGAAIATVNQVLAKHAKLYKEEEEKKATATAKKNEEALAKKAAELEAKKINPFPMLNAATKKIAGDDKNPQKYLGCLNR